MFHSLLRFCLPLMLILSSVATAQNTVTERDIVYDLLRGYLLAANGHYAEAAVILGEAGEKQRNGDILKNAVQAAIHARNLELAKKYAAAWARFSNNVKARQTQAELFLLEKDFVRAEEILSPLMKNNNQLAEDLFTQLLQIKEADIAVAMGGRLFPLNFDGQYYLALLATNLNKIAAANAAVTAAMRFDPTRAEAYFLQAMIASRESGEAATALPFLQRYIAADCHQGVRHCRLTAVLSAFADYVQQNNRWRDTLDAAEARDEEWTLHAGNVLESWGLAAEAKRQYEKVADHFLARIGLARIANDNEGPQAALRFLLNAEVESERQYVVRETTISQLLQESGDLTAAVERLRQARKTVPGNFSLMYNHALFLTEKEEYDGGLAILMEITRLFPDNADSWNALGYVMADLNVDLAVAEQHIIRALQMRPDDPNIMDSLGWAHYRLGKLESALQYLQNAAALSDSAEIAAHLGEVLWELGENAQAKRVWRDSLAKNPNNKVLNETLARYQPF